MDGRGQLKRVDGAHTRVNFCLGDGCARFQADRHIAVADWSNGSDHAQRKRAFLMGIGFAGFLEDNCDLEINCPVLLIVGRKDKTGKVQSYNRQWSEDLGVPITWIENAAHNSNDDNPEAVNRAIDSFLDSFP